jgi:hypothetical protein
MAENEYTVPFGIDATGFAKGLMAMRKDVQDIQGILSKSATTASEAFTAAGQASSKAMGETVKTVKQASEEAKILTAVAKPLRDVLGKIDKSALEDYAKALKVVGQNIETIRAKILVRKDLIVQETDIAKAAKLNQEIEALEVLLNQINNAGKTGFDEFGQKLDTTVPKTQRLTTELKAIREEIGRLQLEDPTNPKIAELTKQAGVLNNTINTTRKAVALVGSDTSGIDAAVQGIGALAGGFAVAQGASALFGSENKEVQQALLKVTAAMSILQGLQQIGQVLDKNSAVNQKLKLFFTTENAAATETLAVAEGEQIVATETATIAQTELNLAMEANPAGVLLLAITAIVGAIALFSSSEDDSKEKTEAMNQALQEQADTLIKLADLYTENAKNLTQGAENAVTLAQAEGKSNKEIYDLKQKALRAKIDESEAISANLGLTGNELSLLKTELTVRLEELEALESIKASNGELTDEEQKRYDKIKARLGEIQPIVSRGQAELDKQNQAIAQQQELQAARAKELTDQSYKDAVSNAEGKLELAVKGSKAEYDLTKELINAKYAYEIYQAQQAGESTLKIAADRQKALKDLSDRFNQQGFTNDVQDAQTRLNIAKAGSEEEFKAKQNLLDAQRAKELDAAKDNANAIQEINTRYDKQAQDLKDNRLHEQTVNQLTEAKNATQEQLLLVAKGSADELAIKQQLIDQQAAIEAENARNSIHDERLRISAIDLINKQAVADKAALLKEFRDKQDNEERDLQQALLALEVDRLQKIADDETRSSKERAAARRQLYKTQLDDLNKQADDLILKFELGDIDYTELQTNLAKLKLAINNVLADAGKNVLEIFTFKDNFFKPITDGIIKAASKGVADSDKEKVQSAFTSIFDSLGQSLSDVIPKAFQVMEQSAQRAIDKINEAIQATQEQIDTQQTAVDKQQELSDKGLANDLANEQKKLSDLKAKKEAEVKTQEDAQKKLEGIRKAEAIAQQAAIIATNIQTAVTIELAAAKAIAAGASVPIVGVALGLAEAALILSTFLTIKASIQQATSGTPSFRDGGAFKLSGPSHEEGGIGLYSGGRKVAEYEGGEYLFAVNKGNTRKYLPLLEAINGDRMPAKEALDIILNSGRLPMGAVNQINVLHQANEDYRILHGDNGAVLKKLENLEKLVEISKDIKYLTQPKKEITDMGDYIIEREGNRTRKIRKK